VSAFKGELDGPRAGGCAWQGKFARLRQSDFLGEGKLPDASVPEGAGSTPIKAKMGLAPKCVVPGTL
jgi:hypothetical protein